MPIPSFPSDSDSETICDWVEATVLWRDQRFPRGRLQTTVQREGLAQALTTDVWSELERRATLFGAAWPLKYEDSDLTPRRSNAKTKVIYRFFSALGLRQNIDNAGRALFEECVAHLAKGLTGTDAIRLGHPRIAPVPPNLGDAINMYCDRSLEHYKGPPPQANGDLGIDIATWKTFPDARGGWLHFVGNCASGADWEDKLLELNCNHWLDYMSWAIPPVRFFATPFVLQNERIRWASQRGGIILDRPRLLDLCKVWHSSQAFLNRVKAYCDDLYD